MRDANDFIRSLQQAPLSASLSAPPGAGTRVYDGPERRGAGGALARWMAQTLDEVDYGLLLLDSDGQLLHANHAARSELDTSHPLQMLGRAVRARHPRDVVPLHEALAAAAQRGLRRLLTVGERDLRIGIAVVPLGLESTPDGRHAILLLLGKRQVCEPLSMQWFARTHGLTPAEVRVLDRLCQGTAPRDIASAHGVEIATVRTQIGCIRQKTGAESIRSLLNLVAKLPPMVGVVRSAMAATIGACRRPDPLRET